MDQNRQTGDGVRYPILENGHSQRKQKTKSQTKGLKHYMKKALLVAIIGVFAISANAGDWGGKNPKGPKVPIIAGCPDTSGYVSVGYGSDYIYKGYRGFQDHTEFGVGYTFESVVPITVSANHISNLRDTRSNGTITGGVGTLFGVDSITELGISAQVASVAGFDVSLGYTHRFYHGGLSVIGTPSFSSNGEISLGVSKDLGFATAHFDLFYNLNAPSSWNDPIFGAVADAGGAWFWDLGLDKSIGITDNISLVLGAGVTYADNYWGAATNTIAFLGGGNAGTSGWNNYYLRASLPIELNCAATITPYVGYSGAPDGFLMDGAVAGDSSFGQGQSDILHAGISLTVKF